MKRRKSKSLSEEDSALWDAVRRTTTPMHTAKINTKVDDATVLSNTTATPAAKSSGRRVPDFEIGSREVRQTYSHDLAPSISDKLAQAPIQMDRKKHGKMVRGKLTPQARIDLHGMTLAQAHPALNRFILNSAASDRRLVLVITGKGKHRDEPGPIPVRTGVLKNQVPHWLRMSPLREVVLQVSEAHLKHGGSGAYYVYLRRSK